MENVEIKKEVTKKKVVKKVVKKSKDAKKAAFMEHRNEMRKLAGLPIAYTEEEIKAYK